METTNSSPLISFPVVVGTGCLTAVLLSALFVVKRESARRKALEDVVVPQMVTKHMVDKEKHPGGLISIYYATQTGTAEAFAKQIEREAPDHGFYVSVVDMEDVSLDDMAAKAQQDAASGKARVVILTATYGEGEPTDNSNAIVHVIKERLEGSVEGQEEKVDPAATFGDKVDYCVFGLANRQYEQFNAMGKFFDSSFEKLGGRRILKSGVGDDDQDLEADFEAWKERFWKSLKDNYLQGASFKAPVGSDSDKLPDCEYVVKYHTEKPAGSSSIPLDQVHASSRHAFTSVDCPVQVVRELRSAEDGGSTVHVEIDISKAGFDYTTADNLGVMPVNDMAIVESVAQSLNYDLDAVFSVEGAPNHEWHGAPFPMPITVRECLARYCDLTSAPRRSDLKLLALYATDPTDRKALARLSSKEGKKEYKDKVTDSFVGLVDLMKLCPSLAISLEHFLKISRRQMPRYYTISSSSSVHPKSVHLTVSVTKEQRKNGTVFNGVCSTHLAGVTPGGGNNNGVVRVFNRPSTFRLPKDTTRPILMVGPGTGVAPMRGLLQERSYLKSKGHQIGQSVLYFGCKNSTQDYIYEDELKEFEKEGILNNLYVAFSREQRKKVYVQHLLSQNAVETWRLIEKEMGSIYVCGGVKMGHDVTEALKEIASTQGQMSFDDAKDYLAKLSTQGRFVQELWA